MARRWKTTVTLTKSHKTLLFGALFFPGLLQHWHLTIWCVPSVQQDVELTEVPLDVLKDDSCSLFLRQQGTQAQDTSMCSCSPISIRLGFLEFLPGSSETSVSQMLLVFEAGPVLWKSQHFRKAGCFCQWGMQRVHLHPIHTATNYTDLRLPRSTCPEG